MHPHTDSFTQIEAPDRAWLHHICGVPDSPIARIEKDHNVTIVFRDHIIKIFGPEQQQAVAAEAIERLLRHEGMGMSAVPEVAKNHTDVPSASGFDGSRLRIGRRTIEGRTPTQAAYLQALFSDDVIIGVGPAGTGKTYLAVAAAIAQLESGAVQRIVLARPAVEAGERLGFLPGDMEEKVSPYLRPLLDAVTDILPPDRVDRYLRSRVVEIAPLAFMRGRTLRKAAVVLDEAQNTTPNQMKMFLTRLGEGSRAMITGDMTQTDLPREVLSGLKDAVARLGGLPGIQVVQFGRSDIVRSRIVERILAAYED